MGESLSGFEEPSEDVSGAELRVGPPPFLKWCRTQKNRTSEPEVQVLCNCGLVAQLLWAALQMGFLIVSTFIVLSFKFFFFFF